MCSTRTRTAMQYTKIQLKGYSQHSCNDVEELSVSYQRTTLLTASMQCHMAVFTGSPDPARCSTGGCESLKWLIIQTVWYATQVIRPEETLLWNLVYFILHVGKRQRGKKLNIVEIKGTNMLKFWSTDSVFYVCFDFCLPLNSLNVYSV